MTTATFIKQWNNRVAEQALYRLSEPVQYDTAHDGGLVTRYVVVSAIVAPVTGPETYIFPADEDGEVVYWSELEGSYRGGLDHKQALENAGYSVEEP